MKKHRKFSGLFLFTAICVATIFSTLPLSVYSQDEVPPIFGLVEFMKTSPGFEGKYVELETTTWKKLHQARLDKGIIIGWYLYRIHYTAADDPYNYATVTLFSDPAKMEDAWAGIDPAEVLKGMNIEKMYQETMESRKMVSSNLMNRMDIVFPEGGPGDFKYLQLDYMKVKQGQDGNYINTETEIWKPIHREFIKAGSRIGWSLWGRIFPSGYGIDFQYVTVNYYSNFSQIRTDDYYNAYEKSGLEMSWDEISEKTNKARLLVKSELWEVVDHISAQ